MELNEALNFEWVSLVGGGNAAQLIPYSLFVKIIISKLFTRTLF